MLDFLPQRIKNGLSYLNLQFVYELRLRVNNPTTVNYQGVYRYLGDCGITQTRENAIYCDTDDIADCVFIAGNYSVYSVEEQIKKGFITAKDGERIGLAGEFVFEKGQPLAIRNFTSLCIRVPHEIIGAGAEIYQRCMRGIINNILICSPPGIGKTTILRDLARIIGEKTQKNLLICDERGEIAIGQVGESIDILKYADKKTAFESGIRAMRPDIIVTDELSTSDCQSIERAVYAGVKVLASAHFSDFLHIQKPFLELFDLFVILDEAKIGAIKGIYDKTGAEIL